VIGSRGTSLEQAPPIHRRHLILAVRFLVFAALIAGLWWAGRQDWGLTDFDALRVRAQALGPWIVPIYLGLWVLGGGQIMVPTLAGAVLWGWAGGALMACVGSAVSGAILFLLMRGLLRSPLESVMGARVASLSAALEARGLAVMVAWRLAWLPALALTTAAALTRVSLRDYLISVVAMLPGALVVTLTADGLTTHGWRAVPPERWMAVGLLLTATVATYLLALRRWPELRVARRR